MAWMIGVDVGGTFTDFFAFDDETDRVVLHKVSSTPSNPARAILDGLGDVMSLTGFAFRGGYGQKDPGPMPEGEVFSVPTQSNGGEPAQLANAIRFFRNGPVVVAVQASTPALAEELVRLLEASLARIRAGGFVEPGSATDPPSAGS